MPSRRKRFLAFAAGAILFIPVGLMLDAPAPPEPQASIPEYAPALAQDRAPIRRPTWRETDITEQRPEKKHGFVGYGYIIRE